MTPDDFRHLALSMIGATEDAHMGHPDFRVNGRIFATLGYPDDSWGTLMLTPDQQRQYVLTQPDVFQAVSGGWGLKGATSVRLQAAAEDTLHPAMTAAWSNKHKTKPLAKTNRRKTTKRKKTTR